MKQKSSVKIIWSIHECKKITQKKAKNGMVEGCCEVGYMTVMSEGRRKERVMHKTLGKALNHVGV